MKQAESKFFLDSSVWIDYFFTGNRPVVSIIESPVHQRFCSVVSLHEVKKKLLKEKYPEKDIFRALDFMKFKSTIVALSEEISEKSAQDSIALKLHTVDSIIYRSYISEFSGKQGGSLDP